MGFLLPTLAAGERGGGGGGRKCGGGERGGGGQEAEVRPHLDDSPPGEGAQVPPDQDPTGEGDEDIGRIGFIADPVPHQIVFSYL